MILMISIRSVFVGRSTKNVASNLPALINSGGSCEMLFAVAMTRTEDLVSCIQVRKWPNMAAVVPASVSPLDFVPANAFSTSSIQTIALPKASISRVASLMRLSLSPTKEFFSEPMSRRINGQPNMDAVAFEANDFPVPGIPTSRMPLICGRLLLVSGLNACERFSIKALRLFRPPTSVI